jgi:hypothetical protein
MAGRSVGPGHTAAAPVPPKGGVVSDRDLNATADPATGRAFAALDDPPWLRAEFDAMSSNGAGGFDAPPWEPAEEGGHGTAVDEPVVTEPGLSIRWVTDALANPPEERPVLIEGLLREGELCVIAAPRAIGKSWLVANMAILLGRGEGFLGGQLRVVRPARVLICQGEVDEWEAWRRWKLLTGSSGAPQGVGESFDRWRLRTVRRRSSTSGGDSNDLRFNESNEFTEAVLDGRIEATIRDEGIDVLVIDPWAVFYAGAENSNDEVEAALDKLRDLTLRYPVAIVITHHPGKGTDVREPEDCWRGASRLADWASTRVTIMPHYTPTQASQQGMTRQQARQYVDVSFLRRSEPASDFSMALNQDTLWWEKWVSSEEAADGRRVHLGVPDVLDACQAAGGSWPSQTKAAEALGVSAATARNLLAAAVRQCVLEEFDGTGLARGFRIPGRHLRMLTEEP